MRIRGYVWLVAVFAVACVPTPTPPPPTATAIPTATPTPGERKAVTFREDGMLLLGGQPEFPFGLYHTSLSGPRRGQALVDDVNTLADAGFNALHPFLGPDDPYDVDILAAAEERGVYLVAQYGWGDQMVPSLEKYSSPEYPAFLGWMVADDFHNDDPAAVQQLADTARQYDPDGFTYGSAAGDPRYTQNEQFIDVLDAWGIQCYPISSKNWPFETELEECYVYFSHARAMLPDGKPLFANLQAFAWGSGRYPTPEEARNFHYSALIAGVNGFLDYTYWYERGRLDELDPALWAELSALANDFSRLEPIILGGTRSVYDPLGETEDLFPIDYPNYEGQERARVHAGIWDPEGDGAVYVVVLNTSQTQTLQADIPLPVDGGLARPYFDDDRYGAGMVVVNGRLVGGVAPGAVHVYEITQEIPGLIFADEFDGDALNLAVWEPSAFNGNKISEPTNRYKDNCYDPQMVTVSYGMLHIAMNPNTSPDCRDRDGNVASYRTGFVNTRQSFRFTYGTVEARVFLPGDGASIWNWPAFWTVGQNWPQDGEIDVVEGLHGEPCWHYHYADANGNDTDDGLCVDGEYAGWHTYAATWEPGLITFLWDGQVVGVQTHDVQDAPHWVIFGYGAWRGEPATPATMLVDYVRVSIE